MLLKLSLVLSTAIAVVSGLRCWECINASSNKECLEQGKVSTCRGNEGSCQNTIRVSNGKVTMFKSCKQTQACRNNMRQNGPAEAKWHPIQCTMEPQNTVCRCCCSTNRCNENAYFCRGDSMKLNFKLLQEDSHACGTPLCNNVGRCHKKDNQFQCACNRDYEGRQCQYRKQLTNLDDPVNSRLRLADGSNIRGLDSDYREPGDVPVGLDINECEGINNGLGNCQNAYKCTNTIGSFICHCHEGWGGLLCEKRKEDLLE